VLLFLGQVDRSPFDSTPIGQQQYNYGNLPRTAMSLDTRAEIPRYRSRGSRMPLEQPVKFAAKNKGQILNITAQDPQQWNHVLDIWEDTVVSTYIKNFQNQDATEMYKYLETFLGQAAKAVWESYKQNKPDEMQSMINAGAKPYNFVNKISQLITGMDPNLGHTELQKDAIVHLEQLHLTDWRQVKHFVNEYFFILAAYQVMLLIKR
jgi:hypothetical protein